VYFAVKKERKFLIINLATPRPCWVESHELFHTYSSDTMSAYSTRSSRQTVLVEERYKLVQYLYPVILQYLHGASLGWMGHMHYMWLSAIALLVSRLDSLVWRISLLNNMWQLYTLISCHHKKIFVLSPFTNRSKDYIQGIRCVTFNSIFSKQAWPSLYENLTSQQPLASWLLSC
jgi:isocitrate lyase